MKKYNIMSVCCAILALISSCVGLFYSFGGSSFVVNNIYGKEIKVYGDGIYANDSILKVGSAHGADMTMLIVCTVLIVLALWKHKKRSLYYVQAGLLASIFYNTSCLILGNTFNQMFLVYLVQFSLTFFTFFYLVNELMKKDDLREFKNQKSTGTAVFLMVAGCSVIVWLTAIVPALIHHAPLDTIDIYTTEPTFVLDLGLILPLCWICGINILKKKVVGYKMACIILTILCAVGVSVIFGVVNQVKLGLTLNMGQLIGMVGSFIILAIISAFMLLRLLRKMNEMEANESQSSL